MHATEQAERERIVERRARTGLEDGPAGSAGLDVVGHRALELGVEGGPDLAEPDRFEPEVLRERGPVGLGHAHMNAPPSAMNVWPVR